MKLIASFRVDHTKLKPGIYVSRKDDVGGCPVTTYDIRMISPNHEPALSPSAIHTIEHLVATYLRNLPLWQDKIIYWGPMGCLTGNYLLHDLPMAKWEAARYIDRLKNDFVCEYPDIIKKRCTQSS